MLSCKGQKYLCWAAKSMCFFQRTDFCVQGLSVVGVQQIDRVVEVVEETLKGECQASISSVVVMVIVVVVVVALSSLARILGECSTIHSPTVLCCCFFVFFSGD